MGNKMVVVQTLEIDDFEQIILKNMGEGIYIYMVFFGKNQWRFNLFRMNIRCVKNKYIEINGFISPESQMQRSSIIQLT